jgi:ABC-type uncharacterized transport system permease subunit
MSFLFAGAIALLVMVATHQNPYLFDPTLYRFLPYIITTVGGVTFVAWSWRSINKNKWRQYIELETERKARRL